MGPPRYAPPPTRFAAKPAQPAPGARQSRPAVPPPPVLQAKPRMLAQPPPPVRHGLVQPRRVIQRADAGPSSSSGSSSSGAAGSPQHVAATLRRVLITFARLSDTDIEVALKAGEELKEKHFPEDGAVARAFKEQSAYAAAFLRGYFQGCGAVTFQEVAAAKAAKLFPNGAPPGFKLASVPGTENFLDFGALGSVGALVAEDMNALFKYAGTGGFDGGKAVVNLLRMIKRLER